MSNPPRPAPPAGRQCGSRPRAPARRQPSPPRPAPGPRPQAATPRRGKAGRPSGSARRPPRSPLRRSVLAAQRRRPTRTRPRRNPRGVGQGRSPRRPAPPPQGRSPKGPISAAQARPKGAPCTRRRAPAPASRVGPGSPSCGRVHCPLPGRAAPAREGPARLEARRRRPTVDRVGIRCLAGAAATAPQRPRARLAAPETHSTTLA